ncbi:hypothetical protein FNV43_RR24469 [Rhamnella rubrinervis]|uniref:Uncharacterized protein n=1 Tax=Rhamnella rubrinervis TaxID=2594499 RepID=A0A8K0DLK1_9ROSA|nr:hypothetical protein FNV43_RR24469 [Rhamnella rubrinervis]
MNPSTKDMADDEFIGSVGSSNEWNTWRDDLSNKSVEGWRGRSFPLYDRLENIFRKDRATRIGAQTLGHMFENLNVDTENELYMNWGAPDTLISLMSINQPDEPNSAMASQSSSKKRARKAKDDLVKGFGEVASDLIRQLTKKFDNSQSQFNYPKYLAEKLKRLRFSVVDNLKISKVMRSDPSNVKVFKVIENDVENIDFAMTFLEN